MTETQVHETETPPAVDFDKTDIAEFRHDDAEAGANIGKMLVLFFAYSFLAMALVTWWAFSASNQNQADQQFSSQEHGAEHH